MKKIVLIILWIATFFAMYKTGATGNQLINAETPLGIINMELAFTSSNMETVYNSWLKNNDMSAGFNSTYWDFLFLVCYGTLLWYLASYFATYFKKLKSIHIIGLLCSKLAIVAALLDIIENIGIFYFLNGGLNNIIVLAISIISAIKWIFALLALLYCLAIGLFWLKKQVLK
jgi:hypothetical protein